MGRRKSSKPEMRTIVLVDAVQFTSELKRYGRAAITPKINQLQDFSEFFFVYKLKGEFIGKMGDGFLLLCPPTPAEVIHGALSCQAFVAAYNAGKEEPQILNTRIAVHYGLIALPEDGNYIDTNLNLTARLEGATPANSTCISSTLYDIVADTLRDLTFRELEADFKGLGESKYYIVADPAQRGPEPTRRESRLSFYLATLSSLRDAEDWDAVKVTCEQALQDFPGNPEFLSQLGFSLLLLDDYPGAIRAYEQCVARGYDVGDSLLFIGRAYERMGSPERAIEVLMEAVKSDPRPFHALCDVADIHFDRGNYDDAMKWAKKSLAVNRRFVSPLAIRIAIHVMRQEYDAVEGLARNFDSGRRPALLNAVRARLASARHKGYTKRLDASFAAAGTKAHLGGTVN
jgi:tetratricopeptide (TPR) repeat protein